MRQSFFWSGHPEPPTGPANFEFDPQIQNLQGFRAPSERHLNAHPQGARQKEPHRRPTRSLFADGNRTSPNASAIPGRSLWSLSVHNLTTMSAVLTNFEIHTITCAKKLHSHVESFRGSSRKDERTHRNEWRVHDVASGRCTPHAKVYGNPKVRINSQSQ